MDNRTIRIAMFSGGRGTESLSEAFVSHPQIELFLIVNAYDDGMSTGRLRRFIQGLLGPSDVRKNIAHLIPKSDVGKRALKRILEYRFPKTIDSEKANRLLSSLYSMKCDQDKSLLSQQFWQDLETVSYKQARYIELQVFSFLQYYQQEVKIGNSFDFGDCAFGNILFSGAFLRLGCDFNRTIIDLESEFKSVGRVLNITQGENYVLVGLKSDGSFLCNEAEIVSPQNSLVIEEIFLLDNYLSNNEIQDLSNCRDLDAKKKFFDNKNREPQISSEAKLILETADLIIYGPGTQHSSLFPSYLTKGVGEAISKNKTAEKVFIANTRKDYEIQGETMFSLSQKLHYYLCRKMEIKLPSINLVTRNFLQDPKVLKKAKKEYLEIESCNYNFPTERTLITDWETDFGKHSGSRVLDELIAIVNERAKIILKPSSYMVSVVVPVLNEERTLEKVLTKLNILNFQPYGLAKEIIVVDGGSKDCSREIAKKKDYIRFVDLPKGEKGRGAALCYGANKAHGNIVVFFPSDGEYEAKNIIDLVRFIQKGEFEAVFGSRLIKCLDLNQTINTIYRGKKWPYFLSKYGGLLLSILSLLLFNRFVTDPLTGLKAFDRRLLKTLDLRAKGVDLETEIIAKLSLHQKYILEVPVEFLPRLKSEGKKITLGDGLKAIYKLFKLRIFAAK